MSSSSSYPANSGDAPIKMCACGEEAALRTSLKSWSFGRRFHTCRQTPTCGFFSWHYTPTEARWLEVGRKVAARFEMLENEIDALKSNAMALQRSAEATIAQLEGELRQSKCTEAVEIMKLKEQLMHCKRRQQVLVTSVIVLLLSLFLVALLKPVIVQFPPPGKYLH